MVAVVIGVGGEVVAGGLDGLDVAHAVIGVGGGLAQGVGFGMLPVVEVIGVSGRVAVGVVTNQDVAHGVVLGDHAPVARTAGIGGAAHLADGHDAAIDVVVFEVGILGVRVDFVGRTGGTGHWPGALGVLADSGGNGRASVVESLGEDVVGVGGGAGLRAEFAGLPAQAVEGVVFEEGVVAVGIDGAGAVAHRVVLGLGDIGQGVRDLDPAVLRVVGVLRHFEARVGHGDAVVVAVIAVLGDEVQTGGVAGFLHQAAAQVVLILGDLENTRRLRDLPVDLDAVAHAVVGGLGHEAERVGLLGQPVEGVVGVGGHMAVGVGHLGAVADEVILGLGDIADGVGDIVPVAVGVIFVAGCLDHSAGGRDIGLCLGLDQTGLR